KPADLRTGFSICASCNHSSGWKFSFASPDIGVQWGEELVSLIVAFTRIKRMYRADILNRTATLIKPVHGTLDPFCRIKYSLLATPPPCKSGLSVGICVPGEFIHTPHHFNRWPK